MVELGLQSPLNTIEPDFQTEKSIDVKTKGHPNHGTIGNIDSGRCLIKPFLGPFPSWGPRLKQ